MLRSNNLILEYLVINKPNVLKDNWIFFPGKEYLFNRLFEQKRFSPFMGPKNKTVLCLEITCNNTDELWIEKEESIYKRVVSQLEECGLINENEVIEHFCKRIEGVYQIYDLDYKANKETVFAFLDSIDNLYSVGRHGSFNYAGMLDCIDIGFKTSDFIINNNKKRKELRDRFNEYVIVD
jgi:protoporphyrinogen oxidase